MSTNREEVKTKKSTIWDEILGRNKEPEAQNFDIEGISKITLLELSRRNMAIEIFSESLDCNIWLCSNEEMVNRIRNDNAEAVCYSVDELRHLLSLKVSPEELRRIHDAKAMFTDSELVKDKFKDELPEFLK